VPGEKLEERVVQEVTYAAPDSFPAWGNKELWHHYFHGGGAGVFLSDIGLLQKVINHSRSFDQSDIGGGSIFDRVARKIFIESRQKGEGTFATDFGRPYDFYDLLLSLGDSTVKGSAQVGVVDKGELLIVTADIDYTFQDEYKDPIDIWDLIPGTFELPGGWPYLITDKWNTRLEAIIRKDSGESRFPDDEFGDLFEK